MTPAGDPSDRSTLGSLLRNGLLLRAYELIQ